METPLPAMPPTPKDASKEKRACINQASQVHKIAIVPAKSCSQCVRRGDICWATERNISGIGRRCGMCILRHYQCDLKRGKVSTWFYPNVRKIIAHLSIGGKATAAPSIAKQVIVQPAIVLRQSKSDRQGRARFRNCSPEASENSSLDSGGEARFRFPQAVTKTNRD